MEVYIPSLVLKLEELGLLSEERLAEMKKSMPVKRVPTELLCDFGEESKEEVPGKRVPFCAPLLNLLDSDLSYMHAPSLL